MLKKLAGIVVAICFVTASGCCQDCNSCCSDTSNNRTTSEGSSHSEAAAKKAPLTYQDFSW
jgi:hypothetical protein